MKKSVRVIYLTGTHAWLFQAGKSGLVLAGFDECNPKHMPAFLESLASAPDTPTYVVIDVIDEQYNIGTVPHVRGTDGRAVLRRHAERLFRASPYRYAAIQGRQGQGRKDDIVLATSIVNPELLAPLLAKLREAAVAVAGVCSLPLVSGEMIKELPRAGSQRLVVTHHSSGLRLSYFQDRKLKMSRLTPIRDEGPESLAKQIRDEVDKTQKYLGRLRLTAHDAELTVHLLVEDGMMGPVLVECVDGGNVRYSIDPISQWLGTVSNTTAATAMPADFLMAKLAARGQIADHYGGAEDRRYAGLYRSVRQMRQAGAAAVAASVVVAGYFVWDGRSLDEAQELAHLAEQRHSQEAAAIEARLPPIPLPATELKAAVRAADKLIAMQLSPTDVLARLSQTLAQYPDLRINRIHWGAVSPDDVTVEDPYAETGDETTEAPEQDDDGRFPVRYVTTVAATLDGFHGDYIKANTQINAMLEGLLRDGFFKTARLVKSTISAGAEDALAGEFDRIKAGGTEPPEVTFEAVVERRYEP